jgi:hypothetical protein
MAQRNVSHRFAAPESLRHLTLDGAPRVSDKRVVVLILRFEIGALTRKERFCVKMHTMDRENQTLTPPLQRIGFWKYDPQPMAAVACQ